MTAQQWVQLTSGALGVLLMLSFLGAEPEILSDATVDILVHDQVEAVFSAFRADGTLVEFDDRDYGDPLPETLSQRCISTTDARGWPRKHTPTQFACHALVCYEGEDLLIVFGATRIFGLSNGGPTIHTVTLNPPQLADYRRRFDMPLPGAASEE